MQRGTNCMLMSIYIYMSSADRAIRGGQAQQLTGKDLSKDIDAAFTKVCRISDKGEVCHSWQCCICMSMCFYASLSSTTSPVTHYLIASQHYGNEANACLDNFSLGLYQLKMTGVAASAGLCIQFHVVISNNLRLLRPAVITSLALPTYQTIACNTIAGQCTANLSTSDDLHAYAQKLLE